MADPVIQVNEAGHDQTYIVNWDEDWSGTRASLDRRWKPLDMTQSLHRTGSKGLDEFGNPTGTDVSAPYRRWSAWHNAHQDKASFVQNGQLVFGAHLTNESDPTRAAFTRGGITYRPDQHRIYLPFRVTWDRVWDNAANGGAGGHVTDPNMDARTWGPGHYFEFRADFSAMNTPGFRFSAWLMPSTPNESNAYDANMATGAEIDWPEYDPLPGNYATVHSKVIGGTQQTQTPNGTVNLGAAGIGKITGDDLRSQPRTIGLRWTTAEVVWYVDGLEYLRDTNNVPLGQHFMLLTREANSGITSGEASGLYIPQDDGLWGNNGNVWAYLDRVPNDKARLDYFRVWEIDGEAGTSTGPGTGTGTGTPLTPRVRGYVPGEGPRIRFLAGHGGGIVRYTLTEDLAGTWDFSDYGGDAVAIGPTNQRVLTLRVNELNSGDPPTPREVLFVPDAP